MYSLVTFLGMGKKLTTSFHGDFDEISFGYKNANLENLLSESSSQQTAGDSLVAH